MKSVLKTMLIVLAILVLGTATIMYFITEAIQLNTYREEAELKNKHNKVIEYLNNKYSAKFEFIDAESHGDIFHPYSGPEEYYVYDGNLYDRNIHVEIENYGKQDQVIRDNYDLIRHREEIYYWVLHELQKELGNNIVLHYKPEGQTTRLDFTNEFDPSALLDDEDITFWITVELPESNFPDIEKAEKAIQFMKDHSCQYQVLMISFKENQFNTISSKQINDKLFNFDYKSYIMLSKFNRDSGEPFIETEYKEGNLADNSDIDPNGDY